MSPYYANLSSPHFSPGRVDPAPFWPALSGSPESTTCEKSRTDVKGGNRGPTQNRRLDCEAGKMPLTRGPHATREASHRPASRRAFDPKVRDRFGDGPVHSIFATLANHPKLLKRWLVFGNHILDNSTRSSPTRRSSGSGARGGHPRVGTFRFGRT
jgi:hypothetical protein